MNKDLYEPELKRHLGPVKAPDGLWDRVHGASSSQRVPQRVYAVKPAAGRGAWQWAAAAAMVAVIAGAMVWQNRSVSSEELAVQALGRAPEQLQFHSEDLTEIRTWVRDGSGLDLPLRGRPAPAVRLIGASLTRTGTEAAEIAYRVGDMDATLVISKAPSNADSKHAFVKSGSYHGANFQSWTMRGQMYTIAAADTRVGCMLCHSTGAPKALEN